MRRYLVCILAFATVVFSASTCEKMEPGDYHDYLGNKINLLGPWVLSEVQVKTAGVIETHRCNPESVMEFAPKGQGYTRDLSGDVLDTWHYETYRAAVTIFTNEEWKHNRGLGEDDSHYEQGKTYYFRCVVNVKPGYKSWTRIPSRQKRRFLRTRIPCISTRGMSPPS